MNKLILSLAALLFFVVNVSGQTTYTSVGSGNFVTTGTSVWDNNPSAGDFTNPDNTFIIADGHTITVHDATAISVGTVQVGQGGATSTLTFGDGDADVGSLTVNNFTIQSNGVVNVNVAAVVHSLTVNTDYDNDGTLTLINGSGSINFDWVGRAITTAVGGVWSNTSTWEEGSLPLITDQVIIEDGAGVAVDQNVDISSGSIQVGRGGAASSLTIGDGSGTPFSFSTGSTTIQSNGSVLTDNPVGATTHTLTISGDYVNNGGTLNLINLNGTVNTIFSNSITSVISGSGTNTFNDFTVNGGGNIINTLTFTVQGNFSVGTQPNILFTSSGVGLTFQGDFTLSNDASYNTSSSTTTFNGTTQAINLSGGSAEFNNILFDNGTKTITGNGMTNVGVFTNGGTIEISNDADIADAGSGNIHTFYNLEVKNQNGINLSGSTVNFMGGEIRFEDNTNEDGTIDFGIGAGEAVDGSNDVDWVLVEGNTTIERDDQIFIDGDLTIQGLAQFFINGTATQVVDADPVINVVDATITADDSHTLTIEQNGDLYVEGEDNFPRTFGTYNFAANSFVRYDQAFNQTMHGEEDDGTIINFARVLINGDGTTKTLNSGEDLVLTDIFNINGGATFTTASASNITVAGSIFTSGANANFSAASASLTLNGTENQTLDVFDGTGFYLLQNITITNPDNESRRVNINDDIVFNFASGASAFTVSNTGGNSANVLIVDIASNQIAGRSTFVGTDAITLSEHSSLFVSGSDFFTTFDGGTDVATINAESTVRFEGGSDQVIPTFAGADYGNIEFTGNGDKYLSGATLNIVGNVTDFGGGFEFNLDEEGPGNPITSFINVGGNWNMSQANVGINAGVNTATVTFNGADQQISASDFENVVFAGTGTKTVQGALIVTGDLSLTTTGTTTVTTSSNIDISGNWSEAASTTFQQDGGTTTFLGGGLQTISTQSGSYFFDLDVEASSTLQLASTSVQVGRDFDLISPSILDLDGADDAVRSLRVSRNALFDNGSTLSFANTAASIVLDGDIAQNFDNEYNSGETYPTLQFEGAGEKDFIDQDLIIVGDLTVASGTTLNGNAEEITFSGANWTVNGNFLHTDIVNFTRVGTTIVSSSNFNNVVIGDGASATTVQLSGNITLENNLTINDLSTLDASVGNFNIQLEQDWNNYGTYTPGTGSVTFIGNASQIRTQISTDGVLETQATAKAFFNLNVNNSAGQDLIFEDDQIQDGIITVLNDLNVESGNLRFNEDTNLGGEDGGPADQTTQTLRVGGDFIFTGGVLEYATADINTIELNGTSGGTHAIDLGGNIVREFQITGSDTYQLTNTFEIIDDEDEEFVLSGAGTLDLEGQIMVINRGGFVQSAGIVQIDEGASLVLDGQAVDPDYDKSGGDIDLVGSAINPATLTALDVNGFTLTQTDGDFEASNYTIAQTTGDGINITGGTITDFSNGTFTNGGGNAYLTLTNGIVIGTISAPGVAFNSGPTFNVSSDPGGSQPASGDITFVIAGGTLSGSANENDDGTDGGGFVRWQNDPGFTWNGSVDGDWTDPDNWTIAGALPETQGVDFPDDADDVVFITNAGTAPSITSAQDINVGRVTINSGTLTINSGELNVDGNVTIFSGAGLTLTNATDSLKIAGSFANAGLFTQNTGKVTFDGTDGSHSINSDDNFSFLNINGGSDAIYTLGSAITVTDSISVTGGTFDASGGFTFNVQGGWAVSGGIFSPGVGTVNFNGTTDQFISGGTLNNGTFSSAGVKNIVGNISFAGDVNINDASGNVVSEDGSSILIFVGDDWNNNNTTAGTSSFTANDGTVVINGDGGQNIAGSQSTTFNNISFQGSNAKNINTSTLVNGDMSITTPTVNMVVGNTITGTMGGTLSMSGGILDVEDTNNFPSDFGTVNLSGGLVRYFYADNPQTVRGDITYNNIELLSDGGDDVITRTLGGDITVNGVLTLGNGDVTFEAGANTITITGDNAAGTNHFALGGDDVVNWDSGNGTLIHSGSNEWDIDADLTTFDNLILSGGRKDLLGSITVNGNLNIGSDVIFDQNANTITNDGVGGDAFTLGSNASYFNDADGNSLPTNFSTYTLSSTSLTTLNASGNQTLFTNGGTISYGALTINSDLNVTLDGNVTIEGDFDMNDQPALVDNDGGGPYNITFNGSTVDIHDYTPTSTVTFSGADQNILDNDGATDNLIFNNVVFGGTGTKTLNPNGNDEVQVTGTMSISPGVSVTTGDQFRFQGTSLTNSGSFSITDAGDPLIFDGATVTWNPGTNDIAALTLENTSTVTLSSTSLDIGNGDITVGDGSTLDFGANLTHNIASDDFFLNTTGMLVFGAEGSETTIILDRTGTQRIPFLDATNNATQITNIPNLTLSGTGTKFLTEQILVNDLTLAGTITSLEIDATNEYEIEVRGNWDNQGTNFVEREGLVRLHSTVAGVDSKTITTGGDVFAELVISGDGGTDRTYTLVGDLTIEGEGSRRNGGAGTNENALTLSRGTLDLNGNELTLGNNDGGDPTPEITTIGPDGRLIVDEGATLSFNTEDDDGDNGLNLDASAVLQVNGELHVDGVSGNPATVTRSAGGDRITITIESGATIEADNYGFNFLADEGLQLLSGANLASATTFSNGSFNNMNTDNNTNTYLNIGIDLASSINIDNVTFNFDGTPNASFHSNVTKSAIGEVETITFSNTSGNLGNDGESFDVDPDDIISWPTPVITTWEGDVSSDWTNANNWTIGVPSTTLEAVIPLGSPFNPTYDLNGAVNDTIAGLSITTGILRIIDSDIPSADTLTVDGNFSIAATGTLITTSDVDLTVTGSFEISNNGVYDNGGITINLDAPSTTTPVFSTGNASVGGILILGDGDYQFNGTQIDIDSSLVVTGLASVNPLDNGYEMTVGKDITMLSTTVFGTGADGDIILDGEDQIVSNLDADGMILSGSGNKTLNTVTFNDIFTINSGVTAIGAGPITWAEDVIIDGTFNGADGIEYTFNGDDWIAGQGSYGNQFGTVIFNDNGGTAYIRQSSNAASDSVEFHNVIFRGTANFELGRFITGVQEDGNVKMTGDMTVENTIAELRVNDYLIRNSSGSGTFTLQAGERIEVDGVDNFPKDFGVYSIDATSTVAYEATFDQVIRGGFSYGNLTLNNADTSSLNADIDINGDLFVLAGSTFDVTTNNYTVRIAGRWDTEAGNTDGNFIARSGTVIFDGSADQIASIGNSGTQGFNVLQVDKPSGTVDLQNADYTIANDLTIEDGTLDVNGLDITIGGNLDISGSGTITSTADGTLLFNATQGAPTIKANGSNFLGNVNINSPGRTYTMLDDMIVDNVLTITAGTLEINGNRLEVGNTEDVINVFGTLNVSTETNPGGTLALGNQTQLIVQAGGAVNVVGTSGQSASVTRRTTGSYGFTVSGSVGTPGTIGARFYLFEFMDANGINIDENGAVDVTNNFSDGSFTNGLAGGTYLRIENDQAFLQSSNEEISNIVFGDDPGGGAVNVAKTVGSSGVIEFDNYTGEFSGETFDSDPNNLIIWLDPSEILWTGTVSTDWFNANNWSTLSVPTSSDDVVIPSSPTQATLNPPTIGNNASVAEAANLTIETGNSLTINTSASDAELVVGGALTLETSSTFQSTGTTDTVRIAGSLILNGSPTFTPGSGSTFIFNGETGLITLNTTAVFDNFVMDVDGTLQLLSNLNVGGNFLLTDTSSVLQMNGFDINVNGSFENQNPNASAIEPGTNAIVLDPANGGSFNFDPGEVEYYDVTVGDGTSVAQYDLTGNLSLSNAFTLEANTTLVPNGNNVSLGDSNADIENVNINGNVTVLGGETFSFGSGTALLINSGANFQLSGSLGNPAIFTRKGSSGNYTVDILSGGTFGANFYSISFTGGDGIDFASGSTLFVNSSGAEDVDGPVMDGNDDIVLRNGSFSDGAGTAYLTLSNTFSGTYKSDNVVFGTGPTFNVSRNGSVNDIVFVDPSGSLQGPNFEDDDQNITPGSEAIEGNIQWFYNNPLYTWTGATDDDITDDSNWTTTSATGSGPGAGNTVVIPDVSGASGNFPTIAAGVSFGSLTVDVNANVTVNDAVALTILGDLTNSGTIDLLLSGTIDVQGTLTNNGTINAGATSTITQTLNEDIVFTGGGNYNNLVFDADGSDFTVTTAGSFTVNGNLTITNNATLTINNPAHVVTVGGNFTVDGLNNGALNMTDGSFIMNGTGPQAVDNTTVGGSVTFNDLTLSGGSTKTFSDNVTINGNLELNDNSTTLALGSTTMALNGDLTLNDGSDLNASTSTIEITGSNTQRITGSGATTGVTLSSLTINNTAVGNDDLQLGIDVTVTGTVDYREGIISSTDSNPIIFADGALVQYDGAPEDADPLGGIGVVTDGNSFVSGPVLKTGDDDFVFPIGDGSRIARMAISELTNGGTATATATDQFSAQYFFGQSSNFNATKNDGIARVSGLEYWDLSRLAGASEPEVTLFFDATSEADDIPSLVVAHFTGGAWESEGGTATAVPEGTITSNNFTTFSEVTLATTDDAENPLPVELLDFNGVANDNVVTLTWSTATELNNDYFDVFRSSNGVDFELIATVDGNGTTDEITEYVHDDNSPNSGVNYYRLRQTDFDGTTEWLSTILVENNFVREGIDLIVYPNPIVSNDLSVQISSGDNHTPIRVRLLDLSGNIHLKTVINPNFNTQETLPLNRDIAAGIYFLIIEQGLNSTKQRIVINR